MSNETDFMPLFERTTDQLLERSSTTQERLDLEVHQRLSTENLVEIAALTFVVIFGTVGNTLVVFVYSKKDQRQRSSSLCMLNLAVGDLITVILIVGGQITEYFPQTFHLLWKSDFQCVLHRFGRFLVTDVTVYTMVVISVDRLIGVVRPLKYKTICTAKRTKYLLTVVWLTCAGLAVPASFKFKTTVSPVGSNLDSIGDACRLDRTATSDFKLFFRLYTTIVLVFCPAVVTGFVYSILLVHVFRHNEEFSSNIRSTGGAARLNQWKIAKVLLAVYLGYMSCYVPYLIFNWSVLFDFDLPEIIADIFLFLPYANSCMNPIFYLLLSKGFRENVKKLFAFKVFSESTMSVRV